MWDAWAAYDPNATGYFLTEKHAASDVTSARNEAISYAAYRVLSARYIKSVGADQSLSEFDDLMDALCYPLDVTTTMGDSPAARRQPHRRGGDRLWPGRRVEPGGRLCRP